jgi:hypothetical protein
MREIESRVPPRSTGSIWQHGSGLPWFVGPIPVRNREELLKEGFLIKRSWAWAYVPANLEEVRSWERLHSRPRPDPHQQMQNLYHMLLTSSPSQPDNTLSTGDI